MPPGARTSTGFRGQVLLGLGTIAVANVVGAALHGTGALHDHAGAEGLELVLVVPAAPGLSTPTHRRPVVVARGASMPVGSAVLGLSGKVPYRRWDVAHGPGDPAR